MRWSTLVMVLFVAMVWSVMSAIAAEISVSIGGFAGEGALERPGAIFYEETLGETYIADVGHSRIAVYDSTASFLFDIPLFELDAEGEPSRKEPGGVAADAQGRVFVTASGESVVRVYDPRGNYLTSIRSPELDVARPLPTFVFVDPRQQIHVLWYGVERPWTIHASDLTLIAQRGAYGPGPGDLSQPVSIWVEASGRAYIADASATPSLKVYDPDGNYLFGFGEHQIARTDFSLPAGVVTTADGSIWVADRLRQVVKRFGPSGEFLDMIGGWGAGIGELQYPAGLASDGRDRIMVAESGGNRFQVYTIPMDLSSKMPDLSAP